MPVNAVVGVGSQTTPGNTPISEQPPMSAAIGAGSQPALDGVLIGRAMDASLASLDADRRPALPGKRRTWGIAVSGCLTFVGVSNTTENVENPYPHIIPT
jgi:hypothetical protein